MTDWPAAAGAGGAIGEIVLSALGTEALGGGAGMTAAGIGALFLVAAALALIGALGVPWREWRVLFQGAYWLLRHTLRGAIFAARWVHGGSAERTERAERTDRTADDEEPERPRRVRRSAPVQRKGGPGAPARTEPSCRRCQGRWRPTKRPLGPASSRTAGAR